MSLTLSMLPFTRYEMHSSTRLFVEDVQDAFYEAAVALPSRDVPEGFNSLCGTSEDGETCYGETTEDAYGNPLKSVLAGDLAKITHLQDCGPQRNEAAFAYIAALKPDAKVALFWE